eukprot:5765807-Amphidinium_carterae.2
MHSGVVLDNGEDGLDGGLWNVNGVLKSWRAGGAVPKAGRASSVLGKLNWKKASQVLVEGDVLVLLRGEVVQEGEHLNDVSSQAGRVSGCLDEELLHVAVATSRSFAVLEDVHRILNELHLNHAADAESEPELIMWGVRVNWGVLRKVIHLDESMAKGGPVREGWHVVDIWRVAIVEERARALLGSDFIVSEVWCGGHQPKVDVAICQVG